METDTLARRSVKHWVGRQHNSELLVFSSTLTLATDIANFLEFEIVATG